MDKRIKLYKTLKELGKLYIQIRSNPEKDGLVKEINHYTFLLETKTEYGETTELYYQQNDVFKNPFIHKKYKHYNYKQAVLFLQVLIIANYALAEYLNNKEFEKARTMASALHNMPSFMLGTYIETDAKKFYDEHICFYERRYGENFFAAFQPVFYGEMTNQDEIVKLRILEMKKFYQLRPIQRGDYIWDIAKCLYSESKNFRAVILRRSEKCYNIRYEQLFYDEYIDYWYWAEINSQMKTLVDTTEQAEKLIRDEFKIIDYEYRWENTNDS